MLDGMILFLILLTGFLVKLPALGHPLTGHFGSYQVINGMMAEMMNWHSLPSLIIPKTLIIMNGKPGLHLLYYPFASLTASGLNSLVGGTIDFWGRSQAAFFMLLSSILIYFISAKSFNRRVALLSTFLFTFTPMVLISGISFQNEAFGLFFLLVSYWLLITNPNIFQICLSGFLFSLTLVARIHFVVCFPALLIVLLQQKISVKRIFLFVLLTSLPLGTWLVFTYHLNQISNNVITSFFEQVGEGRVLFLPIFKQPKFYRQVIEILTGEWLTPLLLPLLLFSLFSLNRKKLPFLVWILGVLGMFVLIPQKVINHSFYLICGVPAACILVAEFMDQIWPFLNRYSLIAFFSLFFILSLRFYIPSMMSPESTVFKKIPELGNKIQKIVGRDDWIIASLGTSPELLYYSKHYGWPFGIEMNLTPNEEMPLRHKQAMEAGYGKPIDWLEHLRQEGAKYFVVGEPEAFHARPEFSDYVRKHYTEIPTSDDSLLIFDVSKQIP